MRGQSQTDNILYGATPARERGKASARQATVADIDHVVLSKNTLDTWAIDEDDGVVHAYSAGDVLGPFPDYDAALDYLISHEVDTDIEQIGNVTIQQENYQEYNLLALVRADDGELEEDFSGPYDTLDQARKAAIKIALEHAEL